MSQHDKRFHYHASPKPVRDTVTQRCRSGRDTTTDSSGPLRNRALSKAQSLGLLLDVVNAPTRRGVRRSGCQTSSKNIDIGMSSSHHRAAVAGLPENRHLEYSLSKHSRHSMHRSSFNDFYASHNKHQKNHRTAGFLLVAVGVFMISIHTLLQRIDQVPAKNMFRESFLRGRDFIPRFGPKTRRHFVDKERYLSSTVGESNHQDESTKRFDSEAASKLVNVTSRNESTNEKSQPSASIDSELESNLSQQGSKVERDTVQVGKIDSKSEKSGNEPSGKKSLSSISTGSELEPDSLQQNEAKRDTVKDGPTRKEQPPDSSSVSSEPDPKFKRTTLESKSQQDFCGPDGRNIEPPLQSTETSSRKPIWIAAYPGSGTELFRTLVQGTTGLDADEVYNKESNFCTTNMDQIAACKTHWPLKIGGSALRWGPPPGAQERKSHFASKAVILLRNPAKSIPSHFYYKWEEQHHISDHSQQGSEEEWKEWRDRRFEGSIQAWKHLIETWEHLDEYDVAVYASYEELIREDTGPALLQSVAQVLRESSNINVVSNDDIPCMWQQLVRDKPSKKRKGHTYIPSFTLTQQETMLSVIEELKATMAHRPEVVSILNQYHTSLKEDLRVEGEQATLVS